MACNLANANTTCTLCAADQSLYLLSIYIGIFSVTTSHLLVAGRTRDHRFLAQTTALSRVISSHPAEAGTLL